MMFSRLSAISQNISHTFQVVLIDVPCLACIVAQREGEGEGAKRCGRREEGKGVDATKTHIVGYLWLSTLLAYNLGTWQDC